MPSRPWRVPSVWCLQCGAGGRRRPAAKSEGIQEGHELPLLTLGQSHLKALIVKIDGLEQRRCRSVVKVGCAGGQVPQDGTLDPVEVTAMSGDERLAGIGGVEGFGLAGIEGVRATG